MKAIIIARVSTEEQREANNSLPAQTHRLEKYCQSKNYEIISRFSFDESAYKDKRDTFDEIVDFISKQKEPIVVCFDKVDRLSRNIFDTRVSTLYEKALKDEIELHFVSDSQIISSKLSAVEKFNFSISLGLAKYYSDAISDNVKRAIEQKLRKGEFPGKARYGYKNITLPNEKKDIVIDSFESQLVKKAYELYSTQAYSMDSLRKKLKDAYGADWSKGFLDNVLKDAFYYGMMTIKGKTYPHKYTPIITKALFDQVQAIKSERGTKRFKYETKKNKMYQGLLRCGHCGLSITPEEQKGIMYYHCTQYTGKHGAEWLTEAQITEQLGSVFKQLQVPEHILGQILGNLNIVHKDKSEFRKQQVEKLSNEKEVYAKRIERIYIDRLDGRITDDAYDKYYKDFRNHIEEIDTTLAMLQEAEDNYYITAKYILELANRAYDLFISSEVEERRQLLKLVLSNLRVEGRNVCYEAVKPFDSILVSANSQSWLGDLDSNQD